MGAIATIAVLVMSTVLTILFLVVWNAGCRNCAVLLDALEEDKYRMKLLYGFGFEVLERIHYQGNSKGARRMLQQCKIIYGEKYAEFYYRLNLAQKISGFAAVFLLGCIFSVLVDSSAILLFGLVAAAGIAYYYHTLISDIMNKRKEEITREFPEVLSKLALLVNAGMILSEAWKNISQTGKGTLYEEMDLAVQEMQNGVSEGVAYIDFARRCSDVQVNKFASTLAQNLQKGNQELVFFLRQFADESWTEKKHLVRRKGEEASNKLIIPIAIMFIGLMLMIMIPIFSNISF